METAASLVADVVVDGWAATVAERATSCVSQSTWERLLAGRHRRRCRALADLADQILTAKKKLHDLVGSFAVTIAGWLGLLPIERQLVRELAERLLLPPDAKLVATARGIQVTGVLLCIMNNDDLLQCQCFIDLSLTEAKTQVKTILVAAMDDWQSLANFQPRWGPLSLPTS